MLYYNFPVTFTVFSIILLNIGLKVNKNEIEVKQAEIADDKIVVIDIFADNIEQNNRKYSQSNCKIIVQHLNKLV